MAIFVLVTAIAMPALSKPLDTVKLRTDARQLASLLRLARQQSITSGQPKTVVFYPGNAKYKINGQSSHLLNPGINFVGATTFTNKLGGLPVCSFSPSGVPSSGGTITLSNRDSRIYVIVNAVAGRVRISDSPPEDW
jgi:Tfp pilus assembly protein FimT